MNKSRKTLVILLNIFIIISLSLRRYNNKYAVDNEIIKDYLINNTTEKRALQTYFNLHGKVNKELYTIL